MTPVEGNKNIMRRVLTKEEAYQLIDGIKDVEKLWEADEKQRQRYRKTKKDVPEQKGTSFYYVA